MHTSPETFRAASTRSQRHSCFLAAACLVIVLIVITGSASAAQDRKQVSGRVVDRNGAGVAGATVWAVGSTADAPQTVTETVTGIDGKFTIALAVPPAALKSTPRALPGRVGYDLVVRTKDGQFAWIGSHQIPQQVTTDLRLPLVERADLRGRLVDQGGKPIAGAEIAPTSLSRNDKVVMGAFSAVLPSTLSSSLRVTTAKDGSFVFRGFPLVSLIQFQIRVDGLGTVRVFWVPISEPTTITLDRRVGQITGRFRLPDRSRLEGTATISLNLLPDGRIRSAGSAFWIDDRRKTTAGPDGTFRFEAVLPGRYQITTQLDHSVPFIAFSQSSDSITLEPGATAAAPEILLEPAVTVSGRVIDAETQEGIQGASVSGNVFNPEGRGAASLPQADTDREGRYRLKAARGMLHVRVWSVPRPYIIPDPNQSPSLKVSGDCIWPDVKLSRGAKVDGLAVDASGQPVAGAEISLLDTHGGIGNMPRALKSAHDGKFTLDGLAPGPIAIRASVKETGATTNGAIVVRAEDLKGKLTITVDRQFACRIKGTVTDSAGKPIAAAEVILYGKRTFPRDGNRGGGWSRMISAKLETDASGRFTSGPLCPGDEYNLVVSAKGYNRFETPPVTGQPGMVRGLGTIKLIGTGGYLAGRVVGSDGTPIAGVTVFNRGNGLQPVSVQSDPKGRFRLENLFPGSKYAFARKDGYRFTCVRTQVDAEDMTIRLLRSDEPPPAWSPGKGPSNKDRQALARLILLRLWKVYNKDADARRNDVNATQCVLCMARIDPELARTWSEQIGGQLDFHVSMTEAEMTAEIDAQSAIALINQKPGLATQEKLQELSERFSETDASKALVFAEEAAVQARALDEPVRARAKARAGAVLVRLGREDAGRKLIEEAAEAISRLSDGDRKIPASTEKTRALFATACALVPFDPKRAETLVEAVTEPFYRTRIPASFAISLAGTDPARAVAAANSLPVQSRQPYLIRTEVVYRSGAEHPDEALRIIEKMKGSDAIRYQAEALGWLAVAVAKRDPERAFALIDRALALPVDHEDAFYSGTLLGDATGTAARIACCARRVGYPDMSSVVARVLATRPAPNRYSFPRLADPITTSVALLALTDPAAAREMMSQIEASQGSLPTPGVGEAGNRWLIAWALADLKQAPRRVEDALASLEDSKETNLQGSLLLRLAEVLSIPSSRTEEMLWGPKFDTWYPGRMSSGE